MRAERAFAIWILCASACGTDGVVIGFAPTRVSDLVVPTPSTVTNKVDLLLVVDNSLGIKPVESAFDSGLERFLSVLDERAGTPLALDLQIGAISTDLGAGTLNQFGCQPGGDGGRIAPVGGGAPSTCRELADGKNFIRYDARVGAHNLAIGTSLKAAISCMIMLGDDGCGFEHPLEAAYRALKESPVDNDGFLRDDAALAVIFLTNEDDCSAPPQTDLFDPAKVPEYGELTSYRCSRYGLICDGAPPPNTGSNGPLTNCRPATEAEGGRLFDVDRYVRLFTQSSLDGGVKLNPGDVSVALFAAPRNSVSVRADTQSGRTLLSLEPSCASTDGSIFGDPAVRMAAVVDAVPRKLEHSICDADYGPPLDAFARLISTSPEHGCLSAPIANVTNPSCAVNLIAASSNLDAPTLSPIPSCALSRDAAPCWRLVDRLADAGSQTLPSSCTPVRNPTNKKDELYQMRVDFPSAALPAAGSYLRASCEVLVPAL